MLDGRKMYADQILLPAIASNNVIFGRLLFENYNGENGIETMIE